MQYAVEMDLNYEIGWMDINYGECDDSNLWSSAAHAVFASHAQSQSTAAIKIDVIRFMSIAQQ